LRFLARQAVPTSALVTFNPLLEVSVDLAAFRYSTRDLEQWREQPQRGPVLHLGRTDIVRVQEKPSGRRGAFFPRSVVVCVRDAQEMPVRDLAELARAVDQAGFTLLDVAREQLGALAHIACALCDLRLLTPGWRHVWAATYVDMDLAHEWLRMEGGVLRALAYPVEDPETASYPLTPSFFSVALDLAACGHTLQRIPTPRG
jgi:hypothetical protein